VVKIALIHWRDAFHQHDDIAAGDIHANHLDMVTAGILVEQNGKSIKVALDYCMETNDYREMACIPAEYIASAVTFDIDVYEKPKRRRKK
jgi:hypothetical protein